MIAACKSHPSVTNTTAITSSSLTNTKYSFNGFVAYDSAVHTIVLSVAGTDPLKIKDWIDDLDFFKTDYDLCEDFGTEPCQVHEGFYESYKTARQQIRETVEKYRNEHGGARLVMTGHSLGAILVVLAALDLKHALGIEADEVVTFGQPRGGDEAFARFASGSFTSGSIDEFRVTHFTDPVPHLPPKTFLGDSFFSHPSTEVYYSERSSLGDHEVCDGSGEDSECADQHDLAVNLNMHLHYLGFDFIKNFLGCKL